MKKVFRDYDQKALDDQYEQRVWVPHADEIIKRYALERNSGERFGDFVIRAGYVTPSYTAHDFHEQSRVAKAETVPA